jgi:hypothetical protein
MTRILTAIFDGQVLRPEGLLDMKPNTRCKITVETPVDGVDGNAWDVLDQVAGSVQAPADWTAEHDHYLYGRPKRGGTGR